MHVSKSLNDSLKDFKVIHRMPTNFSQNKSQSNTQFINVYKSSKIALLPLKTSSLYLNKSCIPKNSSPGIINERLYKSLNCSALMPLTSNKSFKIVSKKTENPQEVNNFKIVTINKKPESINIDYLTTQTKKESIIFNQVKKLSNPKPKVNISFVVDKPPIKLKRKKENFQRLSTMRRMVAKQDTIDEEITEKNSFTEIKETEKPKTKSFKGRTWLWKGAEGEIIY